MLDALRVPIGWKALAKRTVTELMADNGFALAAELAYYFFLALFPALLFLVALVSFVPIEHLLDTITGALARVAPGEVLTIVQDQILKIAEQKNGGLLTLGMLGAIWSSSSGITAVIDALNQAYDIQEARSWWRVRLIALGLTIALAIFIVIATVLVVAGPELAEKVAGWVDLGPAFVWTWKILQWPVIFALVSLGVAIVYYYAPDADQDWIWITPGSIVATFLWLIISLGFRFYVQHFSSYNATYGTIGSVIVLMLWFYVSSLAILFGAELNAEIEHASPYGKDPGEKVAGEKKRIGSLAARVWREKHELGTFVAASSGPNCDVDRVLPPARPSAPAVQRPRASDWILSGIALGEFAAMTWLKLRSRLRRLRA